ncbi:MAG: hypothetical protein CMM48_15935 [Rhodospirillaceae bacterium]|nr:hypothetical protein [Rhodospirillaceae bacterium]|tara:strand:+ start:203 stop:394 length:192 start_codon:yes stop_codon:yes gene_type:complete
MEQNKFIRILLVIVALGVSIIAVVQVSNWYAGREKKILRVQESEADKVMRCVMHKIGCDELRR